MSTTTQALPLHAPNPLGRSPQIRTAGTPMQPGPLPPAATLLDDADLRVVAGGPIVQNGSY